MLSAEPLERLAPAIVAIDLRMADIQCVGFFQDLLQGALLITSSYRCGYCPSGISTINPSESGVRLTWHASRELGRRSEEHTSELQSLMRISYAVFCLKKKTKNIQ